MSTIQPLIDDWITQRNIYYSVKGNINSTQEEINVATENMDKSKKILDNEMELKPFVQLIKQLIALHYF